MDVSVKTLYEMGCCCGGAPSFFPCVILVILVVVATAVQNGRQFGSIDPLILPCVASAAGSYAYIERASPTRVEIWKL